MKKIFDKIIQIKIFEGNPNGRIMCEMRNDTVLVYKASRNEVSMLAERPDAQYTGVYFLFGKDDNNNDSVYIGEGEKVLTRLNQHLGDKDYWNECIAVISKDNSLNKAHVKNLEYKFYKLAKDSGRAVVMNKQLPTCSSLSEYDEAMLEEFIYNTKLLVNTLGFKVFDSIEDTSVKSQDARVEFLCVGKRGANAKGVIVTDGFAVLKDSVVASSNVPSMYDNLVQAKTALYREGVINENHLFTRDYVFSSPSFAAAVVLGRSANGLKEWKTVDKITLRAFEQKTMK